MHFSPVLERTAWGALAPAALSLIGLCLFAAPERVLAQSSGQITLRGVVPVVCTVRISDPGAVLDPQRGENGTVVATVEESCNAPTGYTVSFSSKNGGKLQSDGGAAGVGYSLGYGAAPVVAATGLQMARPTPQASRVGELKVTIPASPTLAAGEYQDVVTVVIAGK